MARLAIHLLGPFHVTLDGEAVTSFESNKVRALLAYLAVEADRPHSRDALVGLLWPEQPGRTARRNLSQALFNLRQAIHDDGNTSPFLQVTRRSVQLNPEGDHWLDVSAFAVHIAASEVHIHPRLETCDPCIERLEQAAELYRGSFLQGFFIDDSIPFEEWVIFWRERCHHQVLDALYHLTEHFKRRRDYRPARRFARRQVELEPWREEAHQQLMRLLAQSGQRSAALAQYEICRRTLADQLGVEPHEETTALYERIRATGSARSHNLPHQLTPFVGRKEKLSETLEQLENPACRLLTLVGPGGVGKTRLALQAAEEALDLFVHGVCFVSLASVSAAEFLVATIAHALGFEFRGPREPLGQLLDFLRPRELLLVMDGFEHLLQGARVLANILQHAAHVKILVTSRERLNLQTEWLSEVRGLAFPQDKQIDKVESYDAVQLFLQNASRARTGFDLSPENRPYVIRICQLLEGMPLGIELASAWVWMFSCEQIATKIQRDLDFLATSLRDVPARHRSMRAIFDHSWNLLSKAERDVFRKLSVFRGGFEQEAAEKVAGASLPILAALADKSLLRRTLSGRYDIHELLRQYAAEKLNVSPSALETAQDLHCAYYAGFLHRENERLQGTEQKKALEKIGIEIDNLRTAWHWAVERGKKKVIGESLEGLYNSYNVQGWFQEGQHAFERAAAKLGADFTPEGKVLVTEPSAILGRVLARQARFLFHLGQYEQAKELYQTSLSISRRLGDQKDVAFCLLNLGIVSYVLGEYAEAKQLNQESLALYQEVNDRLNAAACFNNLGHIARATGEYQEARRLYQSCIAIRREIGDAYGIAVTLNNLGNLADELEEYVEARQLYQQSLAICREVGYQLGIAGSLNNLGAVIEKLGEYAEAKKLLTESLGIKKELGDRRSLAVSLLNLGEVTCKLEEYQASQKHFARALEIAMEVQVIPLAMQVLLGITALLTAMGKEEAALELCAFISQHPVSRKVTRDRAARLVPCLASQLPSEIATAAQARGKAKELEAVVEDVLQSL
jgi:predicted ATPase/DNA-binding SARP family transcriptional activator